MKISIRLLIVLILLPWTARAEELFPLVTEHMSLRLSFDFPGETLEGVCTLRITNQSDEPRDQIPLMLYRLMPVQSVTNQEGEPLGFSQQVASFEGFPRWQANHILVDERVGPHETKTITIRYGGYLLGYQETGMRYLTDRISPAFTMIRMDALAYPTIGFPDVVFLQMNARANMFSYDIEVTVPDTLMVANGGVLQSVDRDGSDQVTYRYKDKQPTYRVDIAIGPYGKLEAHPFDIFYLTDQAAAKQIAENGLRARNLYTSWWGELAGSNRIAIIETEKGSGGQADETCILMPGEGFSNISDYQFLYHELSHLWNVKIFEAQGTSPRWEEGLATFCEVLADETLNREKSGHVDRAFHNGLASFRRSLERNAELRNTPMIEYGNAGLTSYSYRQPTLMFSLLYHWLGEEKFHQAVGGFYQQYQATGASTRDFTDYWERLFPGKPLRGFFKDWVYTTAYTALVLEIPDMETMIRHYEGEGPSDEQKN
ncbi:MAG: hypothetical protein R6U86_10525 [Bacteroidales bacterium]